jgi:hypothetical protein
MLETPQPDKRIELIQPIQPRETIEPIQQLLDRLVLAGLGVTTLAMMLLVTLDAG